MFAHDNFILVQHSTTLDPPAPRWRGPTGTDRCGSAAVARVRGWRRRGRPTRPYAGAEFVV